MSEIIDVLDVQDESFVPYTQRKYFEYAIAVCKGRAIPDVRDGQKPVNRRILYAMDKLGLHFGTKHVKSARMVGEVLGRYHPHGDLSVYEAAVRMSQDFSLRYPLVDGQGNFGSRDGDKAAAMRYTELRLTEISELLLSELHEGTVNWIDNYDGTTVEPDVLPARLPFNLLNGSQGIAVGMATDMPSHNLTEIGNLAIKLLKSPNMSNDAFFESFQGPDFATGATLISSRASILKAYETGQGSVVLRCKGEFEELSRGQWRWVVKELPYGVSCAKVIEEIDELTNPKIKAGKKTIDAESATRKTLFLGLLDAVRDESNKDEAVRLVFEPKTARTTDREEFIKTLLAYTSLEKSVSINLTVVGIDKRPQQKGLRAIMDEWCIFRLQTVTKRLEYRIEKIKKRLHILEGRMIALLNIDKVIKLIRESDDPKPDLMSAFALTEEQAEDILEIKLRQLARLEAIKIEREMAELQQELAQKQDVLSSDENLRKFVASEVKVDVKKFGDERRTTIEEDARASLADAATVNEKVTVYLSEKGWIKQRTGWNIDPDSVGFKDGDSLAQMIQAETANHLFMISTAGRAYQLDFAKIPGGKTDGTPVNTLVDMNETVCGSKEKPLSLLCGSDPQAQYLIACDAAYGFFFTTESLLTRARAGKAFFSLKDGERLFAPCPRQDYIACLTNTGKGLAFLSDEIRVADKGRGLQLMNLKDDEKLIFAKCVANYNKVEISLINRGKEKSEEVSFENNKRGSRGRKIESSFKNFDLF